MKTRFCASLKLGTALLLMAIIVVSAAGCSQQRHAVIAATGTNIGLELSANPASQMPQGKLGYNRAEFAIVPTNRSADIAPDNKDRGAADIADVLMELRFSNIFSGNAGIYQRLAVGPNAVSQPGAALMFARNADGTLSDPAARELAALYSVTATGTAVRTEKAKLSKFYGSTASAAQKAIVVQELNNAGYHSWDDFSDGRPSEPTAQQMSQLKNALKRQGIDID